LVIKTATQTLRQTGQLAKELRHLHLALTQLAATGVIGTEKSGAVHHEGAVRDMIASRQRNSI
jgi:hypothetical protein